jgi:hypothetical protein
MGRTTDSIFLLQKINWTIRKYPWEQSQITLTVVQAQMQVPYTECIRKYWTYIAVHGFAFSTYIALSGFDMANPLSK